MWDMVSNMLGYRSRASGLWRLPYTDDLLLPHNINMMHSEKNIAEALFRTIMDISDKTKDNVKARVDLATLCDRPKLDMRPPGVGKSWKKPKADFVLMRPQRREVLQWFQIMWLRWRLSSYGMFNVNLTAVSGV